MREHTGSLEFCNEEQQQRGVVISMTISQAQEHMLVRQFYQDCSHLGLCLGYVWFMLWLAWPMLGA